MYDQKSKPRVSSLADRSETVRECVERSSKHRATGRVHRKSTDPCSVRTPLLLVIEETPTADQLASSMSMLTGPMWVSKVVAIAKACEPVGKRDNDEMQIRISISRYMYRYTVYLYH
jgi:hypothetical protein